MSDETRRCLFCDKEVIPMAKSVTIIGTEPGEEQFIHRPGTGGVCFRNQLSDSQTYTEGLTAVSAPEE